MPHALPTTAYDQHLLRPWVKSTIEDVCQTEDPRADVVLGPRERWMMTDLDGEAVPPCTVLGRDESALQKGHRDYVVMVTARLSTGRLIVLAGWPDRTQAPLVPWLTPIPAPRRRQIRTVCPAMWDAYVTAVRDVRCPVMIVIDCFHVAQHDRDGADTVRQQACKRWRAARPHETMDPLKPTRWPCRKRPADRAADEQARLTRVFEPAPPLKQAYDLRAQLTTIVDTARSNAEGRRRRHRWRRAGDARGLTCGDPFLKRWETWRDLMAHSGRQHQTRGVVEGLNQKLQVLQRRCVGIDNRRQRFPRIPRDLDG